MRTVLKLAVYAALIASAGTAGAAVPGTTRPAASQPSARSARDRGREADRFFEAGITPRLHVTVAPADIERLRKDHRTDVHALVRESLPGRPDVIYADVAVHIKGGPGSLRSVDDKPALTLGFGKFVKGRTFHGLDKCHLNNSVQDPTYMCEDLAGSVFRDAGVPAPRATNARVWLNDRDLGAVVLLEGFDTVMLRKGFSSKGGIQYQGNFTDIDADLPNDAADVKKANARLRELAEATREPDPAKRQKRLEAILDVDRFLTFMILESMVCHWDGYCANRNNYRIYDDPRTGKLVFMPHGMDQVFQDPNYPLLINGAMVAKALVQTPEDRIRYFERAKEIRSRFFDPEVLVKRVEAKAQRMTPMMAEISPDALRQHEEQTASLRNRIADRAKAVDRILASPPMPLRFDAKGIATVKGWEPRVEGNAAMEQVTENGKRLLRIRCGQGGCVASFRTPAMLEAGKYVIEGECRTVGVVAEAGENSGAGVRISGGKRDQHLTGDTAWKKCAFEFEVGEGLGEVILVCELRASRGEAFFDLDSLHIRKR